MCHTKVGASVACVVQPSLWPFSSSTYIQKLHTVHVHRPLCIRLLYGVVTSHIWVVIYEHTDETVLVRLFTVIVYRICTFCVASVFCLYVCLCVSCLWSEVATRAGN